MFPDIYEHPRIQLAAREGDIRSLSLTRKTATIKGTG